MRCFIIRQLKFAFVVSVLLLCIVVVSPIMTLAADPPKLNWVEGPCVVDLGGVAKVNLTKEYLFLNASDIKKMNDYIGEVTSDNEVGGIFSANENENWCILFKYDAVGYVKDDEKDTLDANAILESIKEGTAEANKIRAEKGYSGINVIGWYEKPHYDVNSHNLVWCVLGEDAKTREQLVNYDTRLLGRNGYMKVKLIDDPKYISSTLPKLKDITNRFSWNAGESYAEFKAGDKVSEIGLTALIAGGAGAVLAKTGFLAKFWKFIVGGIVLVFGAIVAFFKRLTGRN